MSGESANAVPHYHKLCSRVSHIWGNRRGQHLPSAMEEPRPGKTTCMIMVSPLPGKYDQNKPRRNTHARAQHFTHTLTSARALQALCALTRTKLRAFATHRLNSRPHHANSPPFPAAAACPAAPALRHLHTHALSGASLAQTRHALTPPPPPLSQSGGTCLPVPCPHSVPIYPLSSTSASLGLCPEPLPLSLPAVLGLGPSRATTLVGALGYSLRALHLLLGVG